MKLKAIYASIGLIVLSILAPVHSHVYSSEDTALSESLPTPPNKWGDKQFARKKFAHSIAAVQTALNRVTGWRDAHEKTGRVSMAVQPGYPPEIDDILNLRESIETSDRAWLTDSDNIERWCLKNGFSDIILRRHREMADNHKRNVRVLLDYFDALERAAADSNINLIHETLDQINNHLKNNPFRKDPPLLHSRTSQILPEGNEILSLSLADEPIRSASSAPATEELSPTVDVQITPEIIELAASLEHSPVKIYEYVLNNFDFEPYIGSWKGSQETLLQGSGNGCDLASLLIALLRASGIPARYIKGDIRIPADRAMNWLGVVTEQALDDLDFGVLEYSGEELVTLSVSDHFWVEAYLPYTNYRGIPADQTGKMWVQMDPSFKKYEYQAGVDIVSEMGFDAKTFIENYIGTLQDYNPLEGLIQAVRDYLSVNHPELSYEDILRTKRIITEEMAFIPGSLPYEVTWIDGTYSEISATDRYKVQIVIYSWGPEEINYTFAIPEILGKRITVSYAAATQDDQDVIDTYGGFYHTPPHLVHLIPVLTVDGNLVAVGTEGTTMGTTVNWQLFFNPPLGANDPWPTSSPMGFPGVLNEIVVGTTQSLGIAVNRIPPETLASGVSEGIVDIEAWTGQSLWHAAMGFLDRVERSHAETAKLMQTVLHPATGIAIVQDAVTVTYDFGQPQTFEWKGLVIDADKAGFRPISVHGDSGRQKDFNILNGANGSILENRIIEDLYNAEAVSAVKIIQLAKDMSVPICRITESIEADCPLLDVSDTVRSDVASAVADGHVVTIPEHDITYLAWSGIGYIDMNPETGKGAYIISGGHNGGGSAGGAGSGSKTPPPPPSGTGSGDGGCPNCPCPPGFASETRFIYPSEDGLLFPRVSETEFYLSLLSGKVLNPNNLYFEVEQTYCTIYGIGTRRSRFPADKNEPGHHSRTIFGATRNYTIFGADIKTPDGHQAFKNCGDIRLQSELVFGPPAETLTYNWRLDPCDTGSCGGGALTSPADGVNTAFKGYLAGSLPVILEVTNENRTTRAEKTLDVVEIVKIRAQDGDNAAYFVEDDDSGPETTIKTLYPARTDRGVVNISVETYPALSNTATLPLGWRIERASGTLEFVGTPNALNATLKKNKLEETVVKAVPCEGSQDLFQVRIIPVKVELVTPAGDPVSAPVDSGEGQNEYTFNNANPGVLTMNLKAKVEPSGVATYIKDHVRFKVDAIGSSVMAWNVANPGGKPTSNGDNLEAVVTFTGLPLKNSAFGKKSVKVKFNGNIQNSQVVEIFFPKAARNHPGIGAGTTPNWFYYWAGTAVTEYDLTSGMYSYADGGAQNFAVYNGNAKNPLIIVYGPASAGHTAYVWNAVGINVNLRGVDTLTATLVHEKTHWQNDLNWLAGGPWYFKRDTDGDYLPDEWENLYSAHGFDPNKASSFPGFPFGNDEEVWCEMNTYKAKANHSLDWANPGKQSRTVY